MVLAAAVAVEVVVGAAAVEFAAVVFWVLGAAPSVLPCHVADP